jgi:hypothetical protein
MLISNIIQIEPDQICNIFNLFYFSVVPNSIHAAVDKGCFYFNI